jgi:hypothetical protein
VGFQSCRKCSKNNEGFSPCGRFFRQFAFHSELFRNFFSPWGLLAAFTTFSGFIRSLFSPGVAQIQ